MQLYAKSALGNESFLATYIIIEYGKKGPHENAYHLMYISIGHCISLKPQISFRLSQIIN